MAVLALAVNSRAQVLFYEPFLYTNGPLAAVSTGLWTTPTVLNEVNVTDSRAVLTQQETEDLSTPLPGGPYNSSTNIHLYFGFRLVLTDLPSNGGAYFTHFIAGSAHRGRVFVRTNGAAPGKFRVGVANAASTPSVTFPQDLDLNLESVIVLRINPTSHVTEIWLNPSAESDASVAASDAATVTSGISGIGLRQASGIGALTMDDLQVGTNFSSVLVPANPTAPVFTLHPQGQTKTEGGTVTFNPVVVGTQPIAYQWTCNGTAIDSETNAVLKLFSLQTNQSGTYRLYATNLAGWAVSDPANLVVNAWDGRLKVLTWNVKGNNTTNWSVTNAQVQAIGRVLNYLDADVITFNEIPVSYTWEMTNWVAAFLPGWYLATNSGSDTFIRSVIASRFEILHSRKHFDGVSLSPYGSGNFTRDLFQARVRVPGYARPVDVFCTHLKATISNTAQSDADKRGAEAQVISNFLANVYLPTNNGAAYLLTGDLNEDVLRPDTNRYNSSYPIQTLCAPATDLRLRSPLNPVTGQDFTLSIQSTLNVCFDYVLPCGSLDSNIVAEQVFRSDVLTNTPVAQVFSNDCRTASDHLPVMITFANPNWPIRPLAVNGDFKLLTWETAPGEKYRILSSDYVQLPLSDWFVEASNFIATSYVSSVTLVRTSPIGFFSIERMP